MIILGLILILTCVVYSLVLIVFIVGLARPRAGSNQIPHSISVVIAARNEEHNIGFCLSDLANQTYPAERFQVFVVDDHSSDRTVEIVTSYCQRHANFHLIQIEDIPANFSPKKYALTRGTAASTDEIILMVDADCRMQPTWIETMNSYFVPNVGMVIGFSQLGRRQRPMTFFEKLQAFDFLALMGAAAGSANLGYPLAASGQNIGFRRQAFLEVGGYQNIAHRVSGDDILLMQLIKHRTPWHIVFAQNPRAFNSSLPQPDLDSFLHQRRRWASNGSVQIHLDKPFFAFMLVTYFMNLLLLFGVPLALLVPTIGTVVWNCLLIKITVELALSLQAMKKFRRPDLLPLFPFWTLVQVPYIVIAGGLGSVASIKWKDRNHGNNFAAKI